MTGVVGGTALDGLKLRFGPFDYRLLDDLIPHGVTPESVLPLAPIPLRVHRPRRVRLALRAHRSAASMLVTGGFNIAVLLPQFLVARSIAVVIMLVFPGLLLLAALNVRPAHGMLTVAYATALSVATLMFLGFVTSYILPPLGIEHPFRRWPLTLALDTVLIVVLAVATRIGDPIAMYWRPAPLADVARRCGFVLLPLGAMGGAFMLNGGRSPALAIATAAACVGVVVVVIARGSRVAIWTHPVALLSIAVALTWAYSLRSSHLFGFDIQQEIQAFNATMRQGLWRPPSNGNPYAAMLSITALPALLSSVSGVSGVYLLKIVYPVLFGLVPVVVYFVAARWAPKVAAFAAAAMLVALPQFAGQLSAITRQELALLIFAAMIAFAFDVAIAPAVRKAVVLFFVVGLSAAHYSTAYATIAALLIAHFLYGAMRLVRDMPHRGVFTFRIVIACVVIVLGWNMVITHSSQNVSLFLSTASERGADILPNSKDGSLVDRWLTGNTVEPTRAAEFAARAHGYYLGQKSFINFYPDAVVKRTLPHDSTAPKNSVVVAGIGGIAAVLRLGVSQAALLLTAVGTVWFAWRRRLNDAPILSEFATLALAFLAFVVFMRVSGVAAEAYNQERAQLHSAVLTSVGLASVIGWGLRKHSVVTRVACAGAVAVTLLASSGLTALVGGGDVSPTLANRGEAYERFYVTDQELASAKWLESHKHKDAVIFTDRYGKLRLWGGTAITEVFDTLVPGTLDQHAYVYASTPNVVAGRARGQINQYASSYSFPSAFLSSMKSTLYSNGASEVYR